MVLATGRRLFRSVLLLTLMYCRGHTSRGMPSKKFLAVSRYLV